MEGNLPKVERRQRVAEKIPKKEVFIVDVVLICGIYIYLESLSMRN